MLVTLEEYKAFIGINSSNQDTQISTLVGVASDVVRNYCGRTFTDYYAADKTEYSDGGCSKFLLEELPLVTLSSVDYSEDYGVTYTALTPGTEYFYNKATQTVDVVGEEFPFKPNGYRIVYRGGYQVAPADIKMAAIDLVSYYLKSDSSVKSNRAAGSNTTQIEYVMNATLPSHIRRVLDQYRLILL